MVAQVARFVVATVGTLLGQAESMQFMRLPPAARAKIIGALILLTIGGVALVMLAWLALRVGRRNLRRLEDRSPARWSKVHGDDWAKTPLAPRPPARLDADDE
jgi:hypothetical protein